MQVDRSTRIERCLMQRRSFCRSIGWGCASALVGFRGWMSGTAAAGEPVDAVSRLLEVEHVRVFHEPGRFGGWPANHGMWAWGNELLVGFSIGEYQNLGIYHHINRQRPEYHVLSRSLDGGLTWQLEQPMEQGVLVPRPGAIHGQVPEGYREREPVAQAEPIDFTHPDLAITFRMSQIHGGETRYYFSRDRGRNWQGPFALPDFGLPGVAGRTDYVVDGPSTLTVFLTAAKTNGREGRIFCAQTTDGGLTWQFVGWVGPEPDGYNIMPSSVRLSDTALLTTTRRREGTPSWINAYRSIDNGHSWEFLGTPVPTAGEGNPPSLLQLHDGRLALVYGHRAPPFEMRVRFSSDSGDSWSDDYVIRGEGGGRDIGYPVSVVRADGRVVTAYYFCDRSDQERFIEAAIWSPPPAQPQE